MNIDFSFLAATCYFFAMFGFVWLLGKRCTDWGTHRWGNQVRAFGLILGAIAWLFVFGIFGNYFAGSSKVPDLWIYDLVLVSGIFAGAIVAWVGAVSKVAEASIKKGLDIKVAPFGGARKSRTLWDFLAADFSFRKGKKQKD